MFEVTTQQLGTYSLALGYVSGLMVLPVMFLPALVLDLFQRIFPSRGR